jgi:hypothetical protein
MGEEEMKFFKKELCEKLDKLGCTPYYNFINGNFGPAPHFSIYDFLSDEEYAEENCKKLFGDFEDFECPFCGATDVMIDTFKYEKCDLSLSKNQEAYIEEAVDRILNNNIE